MWTVNDLYLKITQKLVIYLAAKETNILYLAMFQSFFVLFVSDCISCTLQGSLHFFARHSIKTRSHSKHTIISPQWKNWTMWKQDIYFLLSGTTLHTVHSLRFSDFYANVCSASEPPWTSYLKFYSFHILLKTTYFSLYPSLALLYFKTLNRSPVCMFFDTSLLCAEPQQSLVLYK